MPAVIVRSLIATGTPCRVPSFARLFTARSASRAQASAFSAATVQNALTAGLTLPIAARCASVTSTGLAFFVRGPAALRPRPGDRAQAPVANVLEGGAGIDEAHRHAAGEEVGRRLRGRTLVGPMHGAPPRERLE